MKINLATKLTLFRIILVPFFMVFMLVDHLWTRSFALFIFIIGGLTDTLDGMVARQLKTVTKFGIFLDPLADKLIVSAAFISFVGLRELNVPAWMVVLVIAREFIITGLRLLAMSHGRVIQADITGKFKTTSQIMAIIVILGILIINSSMEKFAPVNPGNIFVLLLKRLPFWIMLYVTVLTVYSGIAYLYKNRDILALDMK